MVVKVNNLAHSIGNGDKCMNTFLKELKKLSNGLKVLHRKYMYVLYDDVRSPLFPEIVRYLVGANGVNIILF